MKKPYPVNWTIETVLKRLKPWVIWDPFLAVGCSAAGVKTRHFYVQSFDTEEEAHEWLRVQKEKDFDGYEGCLICEKRLLPQGEGLSR